LPIRFRRPVITCFPELQSRNLNDLVLISCFSCARRAERSFEAGRSGKLMIARDNLYLNLAADSLQVQQTKID
jgi:hypothetical protein